MTTRSRITRSGVVSPVQNKGPLMKDKDFFALKDESYSIVVFFNNGDKQFAYQYDLDDEKNRHNPSLLMNNSINVTFQYIQTKIREMMNRNYTIPNINPETNIAYPKSENENDPKHTKDVSGICVGDVGQSFLSSQYRKSENDTFLLLIDHKQKKFVGYIIARRKKTEKGTFSYYIDIICAEPGHGSVLLNWFINFFFRETKDKNDPAFNVESLSLSALSSVLTYYTKLGYLHVENCEQKELQEIHVARENLPIVNRKPQRTSVQFINFLFLLTRQGFNATENPICEFIARGDIDDEMKDGDRFKTILAYEKYTDYMEDLKERMKSKNKKVAEEASKLYKEITNLEKNYEESFEAYQDNKTIENKKAYFDATFKYAKYLYIDIGGCDNNGYYMKRCERPKFSFDSCW